MAALGQGLTMETETSPLQEKLQLLVEIVTYFAQMTLAVAVAVFSVIFLLRWLFTDMKLVSHESTNLLIEYAATAVSLMIACIPEGMPLVISMAMAFSTDTLQSENLLIKRLSAMETAG